MAQSKRYNNNFEKINRDKDYSLEEAAELLTSFSPPKFDESIEVAINLGVDPKHADQIVRGTVALPNGIGKDIKVLVFAKDNLAEEAEKAGADFVGADDMIEKVKGGGTVAVKNFYADTFGKVYRSCGNCGTQYQRTSTFTNIHVSNGGVVAGINTNYGDKTTITNSCILDTDVCYKYTGNDDGDEPPKTGSGSDGTYCIASGITTSGC